MNATILDLTPSLVRVLVLVLLEVVCGFAVARAQAYPARPLRVVVPYAPGGVVDVLTRVFTNRLTTELGQFLVVEAKPGASANIGAEAVARAAPDGYTLLVTAPYLINNPALETGLRWRPADFVPIARFALSPSFLVARNDVPARNVKELIEFLRAKPGQVVADGTGGTTQSMSLYMLRSVAKLDLLMVNYKGGPAQMTGLVNGEAAFAILPSSVAITAAGTGRLKVLANTSAARSPLFPDVPTLAEAGYPETTVLSWYGLHAPAGTPAAIVRRLSDAIAAASQVEEVKTRTASAGGEVAYLSTQAFVAFLKEDAVRWSRFHTVSEKR